MVWGREAREHFCRQLHRFEASGLRNANCRTLGPGKCVRALYSMRVGLWQWVPDSPREAREH